MNHSKPNVLVIMTDQQRFDTIAALGNSHIRTPNLDRLAKRGAAFDRAYSTCPVCLPARYTIRTGCEPPTTGHFRNGPARILPGQPQDITQRTGPFLAQTMRDQGYRTFGIGKFHATPWNQDLGYDVHLHSEEMYADDAQRTGDAYRNWIDTQHPTFSYIEQIHGERSEMYYMPQVSPLPAELTVEAWAADRAVEQIHAAKNDPRPYFGFVSFVGPHPPLAPPIPFNRLYDPMQMPPAVRGERDVDHMDEQIPWMNYLTWSDDVDDVRLRTLRARYYAEITYIDQCLGRILDAVEAREDADNTLIVFTADHGDHMGDHNAWQKESFFEVSCRVPFLLSWPAKLPANVRRNELVCLTDIFAIATGAAGALQTREGCDVLGVMQDTASPRDYLAGYHMDPGSQPFKMMIVQGDWKYIYMANGGREQLFNLREDPHELVNRAEADSKVKDELRKLAVKVASTPACEAALTPDKSDFDDKPFVARPLRRLLQMDGSRGIKQYGQLA